MVQEEAIEKIHEYLKAHFWEHIEPEDKVDAGNILMLIKSLGYVQLDENQDLPGVPKAYEADNRYIAQAIRDIRLETQQDMLKRNFKRVKE